jgi:hypothetical protein
MSWLFCWISLCPFLKEAQAYIGGRQISLFYSVIIATASKSWEKGKVREKHKEGSNVPWWGRGTGELVIVSLSWVKIY